VDGSSIENTVNSVNAVEEVKVFNEDFGEVSIKANLQKAQDTKRDIEVTENKIQTILKDNNVQSLKDLRKIFNNNQKIFYEIEKISSERKGVDDRNKDELEEELKIYIANAQRYEKIERSKNAIDNNPTDVNLGNLVVQREDERKIAEDEQKNFRSKRDKIKEEYDRKRDERATLSAQYDSIKEQIDESLKDQQLLVKKYGYEENQVKNLEKESEELKQEEKIKFDIEKQYQKYEEGPLAAIKRLENAIANQDKLLQDQRAAIEQLKGQIIESSSDGAYSQLSILESKEENLNERLIKEELRSNSIKLLKEILDKKYLESLKSVSEPIKKRG
jgi:hypothetical protein